MDTSEEAARGLTDIQDFLYQQAHLRAARRRVAAFVAREPGLTREQKADIERWYLQEQAYVAHMVTEHIATSVSAVEQRHHARFGRWLRGTLTAMLLITAAMALCVAVVLAGAS
ncbi:hypothetical protein ACWDE0_18685 [Streptomyces sp. 900105755]|uniref:hypothetical protein n=1 Tax=unclassified Streptomyces TaxID=2593676 RepID=UPI00089D1E8E|nr:hypothetical protein [Streptomyces sp. Ag109_O5-10]SEF17143.1 hypothetical protein SAMN05216533_8171 [Streptomyces sp. Ag109_O5-10]